MREDDEEEEMMPELHRRVHIKASPQQENVGLIVKLLWHSIVTHIELIE